MKNCFAYASRNEECGLLFFVKEKVTRILHSSFFILHLIYFVSCGYQKLKYCVKNHNNEAKTC